ncbi:hypothetical protein [Streptacidiphilus sp. EB129]|uniref:hypothetical protein n=1 Tax=Streptacidiphilus sp. EB129 TaxID=3156262 RepID=UPI003511DA7B
MTAIVCMALSGAGLVIALLAALRGRFRTALRLTALALVPAGLYLTGLIPVFSHIGHILGTWGSHLVFDPRVWTGVGLLGAAVLLLLATGFRRRSRAGTAPAAAPSRPTGTALAPTTPAGRAAPGAPAKKPDDLGDFSDIEDILKRRGI